MRKASRTVLSSLGLSLPTENPAPLTVARVIPLSYQTIPPTWSSVSFSSSVHHSLQTFLTGMSSASLNLATQTLVPVMGTTESKSPE